MSFVPHPNGPSPGGPRSDWQHREPMHQPPNAGDMQRTPPADATCARVRGLLRDFADQDLAPALAAAVAEHVHACRVCAVELARAEHEVLQLRRAFDEVRAEEQAQPGFTLRSDFAERVVEQLVLTEGISEDVPPEGASGDGGSPGGDDAIPTKRVASVATPAGLLVGALLALFALTVGMRVFAVEADEPPSVARLEVMYADDAFGAGRRPLMGGDVLGDEQGLWVPRGGSFRADWHDLSERIQPAASIEIHDGELQFRNGAPVLVGGKVFVETNRGVEIPMRDGSRVSLGMGEYVIAALPNDMRTDENFDPSADGGVFGDEVRYEVEVRSGQPAVVLRGGAPPQYIAAGETGSYQGTGVVDIVASGPVATGPERDLVPAPTPTPPPVAAISGQVNGPNGQPSVGASVLLQYAAGSAIQTGAEVTGANGSFMLPTEIACESPFAIALSLPSALRPELGMFAPDAVPVVVQNGYAQMQRPMEVGYSTAISGVAVDPTGVPVTAVTVIPVIIDELFGSVWVLTGKQTWSGSQGRFKIEQLPARLPHHQRLALLMSHPSFDIAIVSVPERGSPVASQAQLVCRMPTMRTVSLYGLPPLTSVTLLEEVPGLPVGSAAVQRTLTTNSIGGLPFVQLGAGRTWLMSGTATSPRVREIIYQQVALFTVGHPSLAWDDYERRFRQLQPQNGTNLKLVNSFRHQSFQVAPIVNIVESQFVQVTGIYGQNIANAQVFAVRQSACYDQPDPRFVGFTGSNGTLTLGAVKQNEDVFIIGPDGGLAWMTLPTATNHGISTTVALQPTGRVLLDESLRPDPSNPDRRVKVTFRRSQEMLHGMAPEAVRFATDGHWEMTGVPAGNYNVEVDGETYQLAVPSTGFAVLADQ